MDYTTLVLNVDLDATIDVEILKISRATLARIGYFPLLLFHQLKISKIYCLIPLKNSLFYTNIIIKHPTFGYQIGYESDTAFIIYVSALTFGYGYIY